MHACSSASASRAPIEQTKKRLYFGHDVLLTAEEWRLPACMHEKEVVCKQGTDPDYELKKDLK